MSTVSVGDARDGLSRLLAGVESTHDRVTITRHGEPIAVIISPEDLESLEETLDILRTPGAADAIAEGTAELDDGRGVPAADVVAEFRHTRD